jgi:hypothetical protein
MVDFLGGGDDDESDDDASLLVELMSRKDEDLFAFEGLGVQPFLPRMTREAKLWSISPPSLLFQSRP